MAAISPAVGVVKAVVRALNGMFPYGFASLPYAAQKLPPWKEEPTMLPLIAYPSSDIEYDRGSQTPLPGFGLPG